MQCGGWGKTAIVFDTDGTFEISRLSILLRTKLTRLFSAEESGELSLTSSVEPEPIMDDIVAGCLRRLHIFRPSSTLQLAASLLNLQNYHTRNAQLQHEEIALLAVDSLSAFYWNDRFTTEQLRAVSPEHDSSSPFQHVLAALGRVRTTYHPVVIVTNWALNPLTKSCPDTRKSASPFFKQHLRPFPTLLPYPGIESTSALPTDGSEISERTLGSHHTTYLDNPKSLALPLTHHITLTSVENSQFPSGSPPDEAEHTESNHGSWTDVGKMHGLIRLPGDANVKHFLLHVRKEDILSPS